VVIGVYRASLTIAGDAGIACAAHRDDFPYRLTFSRTPVWRGALRVARSGTIRVFPLESTDDDDSRIASP